MSRAAVRPDVLHLSLLLGADLSDGEGRRLGRIDDLVVRLGADDYPPVTGLLATLAGRQVFVPAERVATIGHAGASLAGVSVDVRPFARRPDEVLLKQDVLDRQLINVDGARLVRSNEIELARLDGWYRVVGVDTGPRGLFRRLVPRRLAGTIEQGTFLDWASVEPFTGHVPTVRLRVPHPKLARLHPAQLADLVEAASRSEGAEILDAVGADVGRQADVLEELEGDQQAEVVAELPDLELADLVAHMEADDAADLVAELPPERVETLFELLPGTVERRLRTLLGYDAATAGGLMSPDFVCLYSQATQHEAIERVRLARCSADSLSWIFVMNTHKRLVGAIALADLVRADAGVPLGELAQAPQRVRPDADLEEVARLMTDFDLTVVPVTDDEERVVGAITVDDVLELVLPRGWRRHFGLLG